MIHRNLNLPSSISYFLFGPRQTGKSTLISNTYNDPILNINLLKSEQLIKYSTNPGIVRSEVEKASEDRRQGVVIIDEVQRVPQLLSEVHYLLEKVPGCTFVMTGSSARKLKRGGADLLGGRAVELHLFPFTAMELGPRFDLEEALRYGTLPSIAGKSETLKRQVLSTYVTTYLNEEIRNEGIVRNIGPFSRFLEVAAAQSGEVLNTSAVARDCRVSQRTVVSYFEVLIDTLVGFRLDPWQRSVRKQLSAHPKFYLFDTGVTNAINRRLGAPADPRYRGRLFEQFIVCEVNRLIHYAMSEARIYFWRTSAGAEVDILVEKHGTFIAAAEIKSIPDVVRADCSGLRSLREEYPDVPCFAVCTCDHPYHIDDIEVVPWAHFLERIREAL